MTTSAIIREPQPSGLRSEIDWIIESARSLDASRPDADSDNKMPGGVYVLDRKHLLAYPRDNGDSRYPYGRDGFNFWVHASGYMHSNEGLFSHFVRAAHGEEPNIAFFAGLPQGDAFRPVPLLSVPVINEDPAHPVTRYTVFSQAAAYFITEADGLRFVVRAFAMPNNDLCFSLYAENRSPKDQPIYLSSYFNPFLRHQLFQGDEDPWFKEVQVVSRFKNTPDTLESFLVRVNEDLDRTRSFSNWGVLRRALTLSSHCSVTRKEATTARMQYVGGSRQSLHTATALTAGTFGRSQKVCTFVDQAIAADLLHLRLPAMEHARIDIVFSQTDSSADAKRLVDEPVDSIDIDSQLDALIADDQTRHSALEFTADETDAQVLRQPVFNAFLECLKRQVEFCALIKGYIQVTPNSLIGVRDVCQAIEALAAWRPDAARAKLLEVLGFTALNGRCFRQYSLPSSDGSAGQMDLRPFIDQGSWVISCLVSYIKITGDYNILNEQVGYHKIVDEAAGTVEVSQKQDSVLTHMFKIMQYLLDHRDHGQTGCVRALYGDWNDAMDGLGISLDPAQKYGTGVSVMATLHVLQNCREMVDLLISLDDERHAKYSNAYNEAAEKLRQGLTRYAIERDDKGHTRILHGWGDRRSYLVGGFKDPDGVPRDGLTSNAFWVLSGMLEEKSELRSVILDAFDRLDSKYGLKTFAPAFPPNTRGVGRIGKLPPGTAENGACYIHATAFAIMALFQMGQAKRAWEQLYKILPFTDIHDNLSHSPFVMPNSYGHNPGKFIDGQNMNDWQTGSSNVVLKTFIRFVFGIEPTFGGLWIQPAAWAPFKKFHTKATVQKCRIDLTCETDIARGRQFTINGQHADAIYDPTMQIDRLWIPSQQLREKHLDICITD